MFATEPSSYFRLIENDPLKLVPSTDASKILLSIKKLERSIKWHASPINLPPPKDLSHNQCELSRYPALTL